MPTAQTIIAGVKLSHADKVLYPGQDLTKQDLAQYDGQVADWMLPHVANRPISLVRCPAGEGGAAGCIRHGRPRLDALGDQAAL